MLISVTSPPLHHNTRPLLLLLLLFAYLLAGSVSAYDVTAFPSRSALPATTTTTTSNPALMSSTTTTITPTAAAAAHPPSDSVQADTEKPLHTTDVTAAVAKMAALTTAANRTKTLRTTTATFKYHNEASSSTAKPTNGTTEPCFPLDTVTSEMLNASSMPKEFAQETENDRKQTTILLRSTNDTVVIENTTFPAVIFETRTSFSDNESILGELLEVNVWSRTDVGVTIVKAVVMAAIIIVSVLGNILVIVSVALHRRLHSTANYLLVSLATADMLVALCAMTFNASVELSGRWMFGRIMCDLWNSFDVYFSTVSILHLCCISVDRYYAIVRPLEYPLTITRRILAIMLAHCWVAPTLISFAPIFLGWYTTTDHLATTDSEPHVCAFVVNVVFALVSSAVSFWVPCTVMVVMYYRIYQEARKQEHAMLSRACSANSASYSASVRRSVANQQQQEAAASSMARQQLLVALQGSSLSPASRHQEFLMKTLSNTSSTVSVATTSSAVPSAGPSGSSSSRSSSGGANAVVGNGAGTSTAAARLPGGNNVNNSGGSWRHSRQGSNASWHGVTRHSSFRPCGRRMHSTPLVSARSGPPPVGRREHKAARTLGLIMGAFVLCWLPFFTWYVSINVCGPSCPCPHAVVTALFWIGYFNSTLNPFIYAYFRADFREAFHRTLKRMRCCRPRQPAGVFV